MTTSGDDNNDGVIESYREIVSLASEGIEEYLAVVAELQDASIVLGKIESETPAKADEWAAELSSEITAKMSEDGVVPHYYIAALICALHQIGHNFLTDGFQNAVRDKFVEDHL